MGLLKPTADAATERVRLVTAETENPPSLHVTARVARDGTVSPLPPGQPEPPFSSTTVASLASLASAPLRDRARLLVPRIGDYRVSDVARVEGEVAFPGSYLINHGPQASTAQDVITFAGGFTDKAGASRVRLVRPQPPDTLSIGWQQLAQLPTAALTVTELERARARAGNNYRAVLLDLASEAGKARAAFPLQPGDQLFVPRNDGAVEVAGRVKHPGLYPYRPGAGYADYVNAAGGPAQRGDAGKTRLAAGAGDNFLLARDADAPQPGDRLWVPEKPPRSSWATFRDVIVVLSQVATVYLVIDQATK
jgi:protein involved in polysaccharide export with SLBB domain